MSHLQTHRFEALDSWRGLAALAVAALHIPVAHRFKDHSGLLNAQMAVDFFFVLSGFVISHAATDKLRRPSDFLAFMVRRIGRVWPLHVVVLAGFVALEAVKLLASAFVQLNLEAAPFTGPHSTAAIFTNLLLIQSFNLHGTTTWNGPGWSISAEVFAYLVFGLVALSLAGRAAFSLARALAYGAIALYGLAGLSLLSHEGLFATHDFGMFRCLYGFFTGCIVWQIWRSSASGWRLSRKAGTMLELACLAVVLTFVALSGRGALSLAAPLFAGALVLVFAMEAGGISQSLRSAPLLALGRWSYSIYMIHELLFTIMRIAATLAPKIPGARVMAIPGAGKLWTSGSDMGDAVAILILMSLLVACSAISYRWIEEPARRWFARQAGRLSHNAAGRDAKSGASRA